jgi:glycosyltransferase involved in cell wall biosynthesis
MRNDILIFTPTYKEADNIGQLLEQILALQLEADIVVMDDNSPDETAAIVERFAAADPRIKLLRRSGKLGIGSAHIDGLRYAKTNGYQYLITLDADFSHSPSDLPRLLNKLTSESLDVVVGSRFTRAESLEQWNLMRKCITHFAHFLTRTLLGVPYDTSGALRCYRLARLPNALIDSIKSRNYEFFFESLALMHYSGSRIGEVPVNLAARVYGHSKMQLRHMIDGLVRLFSLSFKLAGVRHMASQLKHDDVAAPDSAEMRDAWDEYWGDKRGKVDRSMYDGIASFYRNWLIKPTLNHFIQSSFPQGAELVHAGCGGGEVDVDVVRYAKVTAVDISPNAVAKYRSLHGEHAETVVADIFNLRKLDRKFDGVYNLGVMEHFEDDHIRKLLSEFSEVLRPGGRIVLFWPPVYGVSVIALHIIHFVLNRILRRGVQLHPPEPTKVRTRRQIESYLNSAGLQFESMHFGVRDAFTYVVVIASKRAPAETVASAA